MRAFSTAMRWREHMAELLENAGWPESNLRPFWLGMNPWAFSMLFNHRRGIMAWQDSKDPGTFRLHSYPLYPKKMPPEKMLAVNLRNAADKAKNFCGLEFFKDLENAR